MQITISRDQFLKPLVQVSGAIERKHTLPILSNVLLEVNNGKLSMTGTDLEIELVASVMLDQDIEDYKLTLPAKKLLDICKSLPDGSEISLSLKENQIILKSGKSRFSLAFLSADDDSTHILFSRCKLYVGPGGYWNPINGGIASSSSRIVIDCQLFNINTIKVDWNEISQVRNAPNKAETSITDMISAMLTPLEIH